MSNLSNLLREISALDGSIADVYEIAHDMKRAGSECSTEELLIFAAEGVLGTTRDVEDEEWLKKEWEFA